MNQNKNVDIENEKHTEKIYSDKACNLLKYCIPIFLLSCFTYLIGFVIYKTFDFGLIFETLSFVFILLAIKKINQHDIQLAKKHIIIAMVPLGWLIIYDFINLCVNIFEVITKVIVYFSTPDLFFYYLSPYLFDVTVVASMILLFKSYTDLSKADGTKRNDNYVDDFYDEL